MKIGILTYHAVYNFGANLQTLSTFEYLKKQGHEPVVIDFFPAELEEAFNRTVPAEQASCHTSFVKEHFKLTGRCKNSEEVANQIKKNNIDAVIIGSDAVVQHFPLVSRIRINPSLKKIIAFRIEPVHYETNFPNPFWGEFIGHLDHKVPVAMMSVSCQSTDYMQFSGREKREMNRVAEKMVYISVRDERTRKLFEHISEGNISPSVTPDPVFAFNNNVPDLPVKESILEKFNLPENYLLLSFSSPKTVSNSWITTFESVANAYGYKCVALAMPGGIKFNNNLDHTIDIPLDPVDWYSLIRYSSGYIGEKMHPVIVSLHNCVPVFSFDHYGILRFKLFLNQKASKIYDILKRAGFNDYRITTAKKITYKCPSPEHVFTRIQSFNKDICSSFENKMLDSYRQMMDNILVVIESDLK